jgi:YbbR domain-containing protein
MNSFNKLWLPRIMSFIVAFVFWYAVMSELGKKRDFIQKEWEEFLAAKQQQKTLLQKEREN